MSLRIKEGDIYPVTSVKSGTNEHGDWQLARIKKESNFITIFIKPMIPGLKDGDKVKLVKFLSMYSGKEQYQGNWRVKVTTDWQCELAEGGTDDFPGDDYLPY